MGKANKIIEKLKQHPIIALVLVLGSMLSWIVATSESVSKLLNIVGKVNSGDSIIISLPKDSGWIFMGYYNQNLRSFTKGPFCKVVKSAYTKKSALPKINDHVEITSEIQIVIADFDTLGLTKKLIPPWKQSILKNSDYTGIKIQKGAIVEVRDVSQGKFIGKPDAAVWIRIGSVS